MNSLLCHFLGYLVVSGNATFLLLVLLQKFALSTFHLSAKRWTFFQFQHWLTHGLNMAKREQSSLPTDFRFTSKKFSRDNQNVGEDAGSADAADVLAGLSSD